MRRTGPLLHVGGRQRHRTRDGAEAERIDLWRAWLAEGGPDRNGDRLGIGPRVVVEHAIEDRHVTIHADHGAGQAVDTDDVGRLEGRLHLIGPERRHAMVGKDPPDFLERYAEGRWAKALEYLRPAAEERRRRPKTTVDESDGRDELRPASGQSQGYCGAPRMPNHMQTLDPELGGKFSDVGGAAVDREVGIRTGSRCAVPPLVQADDRTMPQPPKHRIPEVPLLRKPVQQHDRCRAVGPVRNDRGDAVPAIGGCERDI